MNLEEKISKLFEKLDTLEHYANIMHILNFDTNTICPEEGREYENESYALIASLAYKITKSEDYINLVKEINSEKDKLDPYKKKLIEDLYREISNNEKISPELFEEATKLSSEAYNVWLKAKRNSDYKKFAPILEKMVKMRKKLIDLRPQKEKTYYDTMIGDFEQNFYIEDYDAFFQKIKDALVPLIKKIRESKVKIRTDFMKRKYPLHKQEEFSKYLMEVVGFDMNKGAISTTEHPFTDTLARYDSRITTHYYEDNFISNMYSVIHESGHAIFGQNEPDEIYDNHLQNSMTMGMHESVSRFYENRIGRSKEFIHLIYPKLRELFSEQLSDVSEEELYLGVNAVDLNEPLRTEADELTYSIHVLIRYELEKEFINNPEFDFSKLNKMWNEKYEEYLGIKVKSDKEGVLQDVHWTDSYGYFPTYAIGNAYNAMYFNKMNEEIDIYKCIEKGQINKITDWMKEHVFKKASLLRPKEWIKDITNRSLDPQDFIDYITSKYSEIYKL